MLGFPEDAEIYQSVWEHTQDKPGGYPLRRRTEFPEYLSPDEIASLIYEQPEEQKAVSLQISRAVAAGEIKPWGLVGMNHPVDPGMVVRNLHSHIRILEERQAQFENDIDQYLSTLIRQFEKDLKSVREAVAGALITEIRELREEESAKKWDAGRIKSAICGSLLEPKAKRPLRGQTGIGYATKTQIAHVYLIHKDEFAGWLRSKDEWPILSRVPLKRWYETDEKPSGKPTVRAVRIEMLQLVAKDLESEGINPLAFPGKVREIYERCRTKAVETYRTAAHGFQGFEGWRTHFWHKRPPGICDLADQSNRAEES